jgi:hypothetical protein
VPADAGTGVERLEPERLGGGAPDRVPQVDVQLTAEDGHLVDQGNVHMPVGVLQQLGHLGLAGRLRLNHRVADLAVEFRGGRGAGGGDAADDLRGVADAVALVARVDALRRERQVEVDAGREAAHLLQHRADDLVGGARVRSGLEHDGRARLEPSRGGLRRGLHGREVGAV